MSKPIFCHIGVHRWHTARNEEGQPYQVCERCNAERDQFTLTNSLGPG